MTKGKLMILEQAGEKKGSTWKFPGIVRGRSNRKGSFGSAAASLPRSRYSAPDGTLSRMTLGRGTSHLAALVAGSFPVDQLADGRTGAGNRLLIGFHFGSRGFLAHCADTESHLLIFRTHLDDLEIMFHAG